MDEETSTELALVPPAETALAVFSTPNGLAPWLLKIRTEIDEFMSTLPELTTVSGRKRYASMAHKIARTKTALDAAGKQISAEQKEIPKKIDAERKRSWDTLEAWQAEVRKPLDDWQAAEDTRIDELEAVVAWLQGFGLELDQLNMDQLNDKAGELAAYKVGPELQEFEVDASRAWIASTASLKAAIAKRTEADAAAAELARVTAELAERDRKDNEARIAREATEAAERNAEVERQASAKREDDLRREAEDAQHRADRAANDLIAANEQAERDRIEREEQAERDREAAAATAERNRVAAEQKAVQDRLDAEKRQAEAVERAAQAERQRQADEQAQIEREARAREADTAHKSAVLGAVKVALMTTGITEDQAKAVTNLIRKGLVPAVAITY